METTPDELWSPDAVDPYNLVPDLARMQDTVQDALAGVGHNRGTTAQRTAATAGAVDGDYWSDTTTGLRYRFNGSTGLWVAQLGQAKHRGNVGAGIAGIGIPSAAIDLPGGLIFKTGQAVGYTTVAFGNEYFDSVTFPTAFPTACLHVSITPLSGAPVTSASGNPIAIDNLSATAFRALVAGSGISNARGFTWMAVGY